MAKVLALLFTLNCLSAFGARVYVRPISPAGFGWIGGVLNDTDVHMRLECHFVNPSSDVQNLKFEAWGNAGTLTLGSTNTLDLNNPDFVRTKTMNTGDQIIYMLSNHPLGQNIYATFVRVTITEDIGYLTGGCVRHHHITRNPPVLNIKGSAFAVFEFNGGRPF